jgi:small subunit ribosomal protein S8e
MARWQGRSRKRPSGGRIPKSRKKRKREMGREFTGTLLGSVRQAKMRAYGGKQKLNLLSSDVANILDPKSGQFKQAKILTVKENPADRHFVRRNIVTKGAIIDTELGTARVTSRLGQDGVINAVLLESKEPRGA